jgi:hypothetical protein
MLSVIRLSVVVPYKVLLKTFARTSQNLMNLLKLFLNY